MKNIGFYITLISLIIIIIVLLVGNYKECAALKLKVSELEVIQLKTIRKLLHVTKIMNWHVRYTLEYHPIDPNEIVKNYVD